LFPGEVVLASTIEYVKIPRSVACDLKLKSTLGRLWINHSMAGWCDPGFEGNITLELHGAQISNDPHGVWSGSVADYRTAAIDEIAKTVTGGGERRAGGGNGGRAQRAGVVPSCPW
ncbi:MAG TPA: hypothetical protein VIH93_14700, partial [Thermoanaerobaculia bacterium]